jgi:hypothetical protein
VIDVVLGEAMAEVAYQAYERLLLEEVKKGPIPRHVAIIMDGNRRFARLFGMDSIEGHRKGREKLEEVLEWCRDLGIRILTVYAFSTENFKRREEEVRYIMDMLRDGLYRVADDERTHRYRIRVRVIGRKHLLPEDVRKAAEYAEERTKDYSDFHLNLAGRGRHRRGRCETASLHGGPPRPGPHPQDIGGGEDIQLPAVAVRVLRTILLRHLLAQLQETGLPEGHKGLSAEGEEVWALGSFS